MTTATAGRTPLVHHPPDIRPPTEREFRLFQDFLSRETGIWLSEHKRPLLVSRLTRRLRQLGLTRFGDYYELAKDDAAERARMIESLCTHETSFFREPRQFQFLESSLLPAWLAEGDEGSRPRRVRVWSAGCSTGEEPFSIAMLLAEWLPGWDCRVVATDLSSRALEKARSATWPIRRAQEIPAPLLKRFMLRGTGGQEGLMRAGMELRSLVCFEQLNLNDAYYSFDEPFDLIFCRNVMIYFDPASRMRVVDRLLRHLVPNGYLFLGHAESLLGHTDRVRSVLPSVYALLPGWAGVRED